MFCEPYRQALTDGAAGRELAPRVLAHLAVCRACADAYASECSLLERIDSDLRARSAVQVSPAFVSRVRLATAGERIGRSWLQTVWAWVPAATAAAVVLVLAARIFLPGDVRRQPPKEAASSAPETIEVRKQPLPSRVASRDKRPKRTLSMSPKTTPAEAEVIVAPGEEAALIRYAALLRKRSELVESLAKAQRKEPLAIEPLEIGILDAEAIQIEPLVRDTEGTAK